MSKRMQRLVILASIVLFPVACGRTPDEELIAQHVADMREAVENKDFTEISGHLHPEFTANNHMDTEEVKRLLQVYSLQHRKIGITIVDSATTMDPVYPDRAETTLSVVVTGSSGLLPSDGSVRRVTLTWVNESGDWQVGRASWR